MTPTERLRAAQQRPAGIAHDYATSVVRTDDLAALLAERDALAAVAEAGEGLRVALRATHVFHPPGYSEEFMDGHKEPCRGCLALAAYDRAVSKP